MDEDEAEAASAGICRSLMFHIADPPACYRRMNAQEVLSKHVADAEVSHATQTVLTVHNACIVEGATPSVGANLMRAIEPSWPQSDTLIHMQNFQSEAAAVDTFIASHTHGDPTCAVLKVGEREYRGFDGYGWTFAPEHVPSVQRSSTVLLKRDFFKPSTIRAFGANAIHDLEHALSAKIASLAASNGSSVALRLIQAHIIRQGSLLACWKAHLDTTGDLKGANITAVANVTAYPTAMRVCGARSHADYSQQGDTAIFSSDMWHYTSSASVGTIKLAFFYSVAHIERIPCANNLPFKKRELMSVVSDAGSDRSGNMYTEPVPVGDLVGANNV